jgi:hypothetical protein
MKLTNSWKSQAKQNDKLHLKVRISFITLLEIYVDISRKDYYFTLFNFRLRNI